MKKIILRDVDEFVNKTCGWNQLFSVGSYRHVKFNLQVHPTFSSDLFVCEGETFRYYRWLIFGLDLYKSYPNA